MKKYLLILAGLLLSVVIIVPRFYHLGSQPPGLHIDEVSFAADAKAIAETGRDTWNQRFPVVFKAFGEWKAPGLTYSIAFWSKLLGRMDTTIVRIPSALAGLTILVCLYFTLLSLLGDKAKGIAIFTVFVLAFSPWHFDMSRIFYEALSAGALLILSLTLLIKAILAKDYRIKTWIIIAILASLAGYFYASIRYSLIAILLLTSLLLPLKSIKKLKLVLIVMSTIVIVGIAWIPDLFSKRGLTRLYFYQEKSSFSSSLNINEKRQYCYLSFAKDPALAKICYVFWNKPLFKVIDAGETYLSYLSPQFLFMSSGAEHGFDGYYGVYLLPLAPLYLLGLIQILLAMGRYTTALFSRKSSTSSTDLIYFILGVSILISLFPAAISASLTPRMGVLFLYIASVMIALGADLCYRWIKSHLPRLSAPLFLGYVLVVVFFIIQSLLHYFAVFTRSNDWAWTSDAETVFTYVKSVAPQYDRIIDTTLHGPLAPYFYGAITTDEVQHGERSTPDEGGWSFLIKAGKYELIRRDIRDLACEKWGNSDHRKTLVITQKVDGLDGVTQFKAMTWNGVEVMHEIYDLDLVVAHELDHNSSFKGTCTAKPK
jgi:hypothetical protein